MKKSINFITILAVSFLIFGLAGCTVRKPLANHDPHVKSGKVTQATNPYSVTRKIFDGTPYVFKLTPKGDHYMTPFSETKNRTVFNNSVLDSLKWKKAYKLSRALSNDGKYIASIGLSEAYNAKVQSFGKREVLTEEDYEFNFPTICWGDSIQFIILKLPADKPIFGAIQYVFANKNEVWMETDNGTGKRTLHSDDFLIAYELDEGKTEEFNKKILPLATTNYTTKKAKEVKKSSGANNPKKEAKKSPQPSKKSGNSQDYKYVVVAGDNFGEISRKFYPSWKNIYGSGGGVITLRNANPQIKKDKIMVGDTVYIPINEHFVEPSK